MNASSQQETQDVPGVGRRRIVPAMTNCEQLYQTLMETINESLIMLDAQQKISHANRKFFALTGFTPEDALGRDFATFLHQDHRERLDTQMRALRQGQKASLEIELPDKDGLILHVIMSAAPFPDETGTFAGILAVLTDITEQKRINDAVLIAKKEWERSFDAVQDYLCIVDRHNAVKRVNVALARYFDVHPRELIGKPCDDLFDFCLPPLRNTQDFSELTKEKVLQREVFSYTLGGFFQVSVYPYDDPSIGLQGLVYVIRDVKAQKQLETLLRDAHKEVEEVVRQRTQDLRQANKDLIDHIQEKEAAQKELLRLASIIEQVDEGVVLTDTSWTITYVNPAFTKMTGIGREQALSAKMDLLSFIQHPSATRINMDALMHGKGVWHGRFTRRREDGSRYDVKAQISPMKDQHGTVINHIAMLSDVTQELRMERRIRNSEKMEAIGIFAGGIAHDFNNILGGIIGAVELAQDQLREDDPLREDLMEALGYADNARNLVRQILNFKRQESLVAFPLSAVSAIQEAVALIRGLMPPDIRIVQNLQPTSWMVLTNSTHVQQIMMNLCSNAAHAMDNKGNIEVMLSEKTLDAPLAVHDSHLPPGDYLHLTVKDTGQGIPRDILEQIFEPLFSTKKDAGGTGMGLPIVNAVVHRLGGGMLLESEPGQGTAIHVFLPRCVPEEENGQCR